MRGFISEVAADLYGRYGRGVSDLAVLFPSRRARLFFVEALSQLTEEPMWQPEWLAIDDLMSEIAGLKAGDRIRLVTELYRIYNRFHAEPFDRFYAWGELLLNDFDAVDKYRIDAGRLFRNVSDLKELEADVSYLSSAQLGILRSFWASLLGGDDLSEEKRRFLNVWRSLADIYRLFRERLVELGIGYAGMIQRMAVDRLESGEATVPGAGSRRFVVAGFNALSECEKRLFRALAAQASVDFYWDRDDYYVDDRRQEAGLFVRENLRLFPPRAELTHDAMRWPKRIEAVATPSDAVQCKWVGRILRELVRARGGAPLGTETAVVLTDENLLLPLLHALPPEAGEINVTMGYPLRRTLASTFVERLLELQRHRRARDGETLFYHADVSGLLAHPYVAESDPESIAALGEELVANRRFVVPASWLQRSDLLRLLFAPAEGWRALADYLSDAVAAAARLPYEGEDTRRRVEYLAVVAEHLSKTTRSIEACGLDVSEEVFSSLVRRMLRTLRIPFEGEPLAGVQVMGILETRNLDFENVILLSMNDDNFPGNLLAQPSFVPYNLRAAYGLPTPEHHEGVYAYYFYRLLQRARNVWMLYCAQADDRSTGEPSRYIYQLGYESGLPLVRTEVGVDVNLVPTVPRTVAKDAATMRRLARFLTAPGPEPDAEGSVERASALSPTAFARYVACPLRFYFHTVAGIRPEEELTEEVDNPLFGTILHDAAQRLYERVRGEQHPGDALRALVRSGAADEAVRASIESNCLHDTDATEAEYSGSLLVVKDIVTRYLKEGIVRYDAAHDAFAVRGIETEVACDFAFESAGRRLAVRFAGRADRVDSLDDGALRVVDYKTGMPHLEYRGMESLFAGRGRERLPNVLQTMLYALMLHRTEGRDVEPALYYVRAMHDEDYAPQLVDRTGEAGPRYASFGDAFEERVRSTLAELYDSSVPFVGSDDPETCRYCDFRALCHR